MYFAIQCSRVFFFRQKESLIKLSVDPNAAIKAGEAGDRLIQGLRKLIDDYNLPFVAYNQGSICHLETVGALFLQVDYLKILKILREIKMRKHAMEGFSAAYMAKGMVTLVGSRIYTSMANTPEVIDDALVRFDIIFQNVEAPK